MTARRCDAGTLELGAGLEVLVSASLATVRPGEAVDVVLDSRASALELPTWARRVGHEVLAERQENGAYVVSLAAGTRVGVLAHGPPDGDGFAGEHFGTDELRRLAGDPPPDADPTAGLVPLGAIPEATVATYDWALSSRDRIWTDKVAGL